MTGEDMRLAHSEDEGVQDEDRALARELLLAWDSWRHDPDARINQIRLDNAKAWLLRRLGRDELR